MDSSNCNRKCTANWGVPIRDRAERGEWVSYWLEKKSKFSVRMNRPFLCQKDRWANRVDELGQA